LSDLTSPVTASHFVALSLLGLFRTSGALASGPEEAPRSLNIRYLSPSVLDMWALTHNCNDPRCVIKVVLRSRNPACTRNANTFRGIPTVRFEVKIGLHRLLFFLKWSSAQNSVDIEIKDCIHSQP
jgi:hypothetical protein